MILRSKKRESYLTTECKVWLKKHFAEFIPEGDSMGYKYSIVDDETDIVSVSIFYVKMEIV